MRFVGDSRWRLHLSTALLLEHEAVARREAKAFWLNPERVEDVLDHPCGQADEHSISFRWRPFLRDPDDDFIWELAAAAGAKYIVTHNRRDFAGVETFGIEVITPAEMLLRLEETT